MAKAKSKDGINNAMDFFLRRYYVVKIKTEDTIVFESNWKKYSLILLIVLFCIGIIPGLLYYLLSGRHSVTVFVNGDGVTAAGNSSQSDRLATEFLNSLGQKNNKSVVKLAIDRIEVPRRVWANTEVSIIAVVYNLGEVGSGVVKFSDESWSKDVKTPVISPYKLSGKTVKVSTSWPTGSPRTAQVCVSSGNEKKCRTVRVR